MIFRLTLISLSFLIFTGCANDPKVGNDENPEMLVPDSGTIQAADPEYVELTRIINNNPGVAENVNNRAQYFLGKGQYDMAYADIGVLFSLDSNKASHYITLADYHVKKGDGLKARYFLEQAYLKNPKDVPLLVKMGEFFFYIKKYDQSLNYLKEALKIDNYSAEAFFYRGMNFKEKGDSSKAKSSFQTAVEQNPDYYDAYIQLVLIEMALPSAQALDFANSALRIKPNSTEALHTRGQYFYLTQDFDKSIQDYTRILEIDTNYYQANYNLGVIQYNLNVMGPALENFNKTLKKSPRYAQAFYMRGLCYESFARDSEAAADYRKAIELNPNYTMARKGLERLGLKN
ncbi:MAG: tetratricopeptide (TPR) repeat protein [Sphingobacteriales bacterium]|jgi:tetratricopeptide (TPR) repeat protein